MAFMLRALALATLFFVIPLEGSSQAPSVLHIKVALVDTEGKTTPVARHALLVSDNPPTATPRRVVTGMDGTAELRLRPGNYTVESDEPVTFLGKGYLWTQMVDIAPGRDAVLELTAGNAEIESISSATSASAGASPSDPSFLLNQWRDSVVAIWSPLIRASGFVVDAKGLIVTSQRVVGMATSVEVQFTPSVKVPANVLTADPVRNVAVLWIDPKVIASVKPVLLGCAEAAKPALADGQEIFTIGVLLRGRKDMSSGIVSRVEPHAILSDMRLAPGSAGGPVFTADGGVVGLSSIEDEKYDRRRDDSRVVPAVDACDAVALAEKKMKGAVPPSGTPLPVEPLAPFPVDALKEAAKRRAGSLNPYLMSSSDFDIAFITPVMVYAAQHQLELASGRERRRGPPSADAEQAFVRPVMDFGQWSSYVADASAVLLVRVTPKLVEGFWTKAARAAAQTQGVSLPPMKRFKADFSRMRVLCGAVEVTPIHPFKLEERISENDTVEEGLYVFDPGMLGPHCGTVKLVLYSAKEPQTGDTRVVDPKVLEQIWQDFAPYRGQK